MIDKRIINNCKFSDNHAIIPTNLISRSYTADEITKLLANGKATLKNRLYQLSLASSNTDTNLICKTHISQSHIIRTLLLLRMCSDFLLKYSYINQAVFSVLNLLIILMLFLLNL